MDDIVEFFTSSGVKTKKDGDLIYKNKPVTPEVIFKIATERMSRNEVREFGKLYDTDQKLQSIIDQIKNKSKAPAVDLSKILFRDGLPYYYSEIRFFSNEINPRESWVLYPSGDYISIHSEVLRKLVSYSLGEQADEFLAGNVAVAKPGYFPGNPEPVVVEKNKEVRINFWKRPDWELCEDPTYHVEKFEKFMEYLFPVELDRRFMYAYASAIVNDRAGAAVILAGIPGTGKNTFAEDICGALVGPRNFTKAVMGESRGEGARFHSGVERCRLRFYDEINLTGPIRNDIKSFMNPTAAIELKGVNIGDPYTMHASFILANNSPSRVVLEYDDRKFFVPRLANQSMEVVFGSEWIVDFKEELKSPQAIKSIYHMCVERGFGVDTRKPHKTEEFYRYCLNSMPYDVKRILKVLETQEWLEVKKPGYKIEPSEIQQKLEEYHEKSGVVLAEVRIEGRRCIVCVPGYNPTSKADVL